MKVLVEIVYAVPHKQAVIEVEVDEGAMVEDAINASGILACHSEIDLRAQRIGVWGRVVSLQTSLRDGDRIELYRPLSADPRQARRRRVQEQRGLKPRR